MIVGLGHDSRYLDKKITRSRLYTYVDTSEDYRETMYQSTNYINIDIDTSEDYRETMYQTTNIYTLHNYIQ